MGVTREPATQIKPFIKSKGINYLIAIGNGAGYETRGIPHAWLIDTKGSIVWEGHPASLKDPQIEALVKDYRPWPTLKLGGDLRKASAYVNGGRLGDGIKELTKFLKKPKDDTLVDDAEKALKRLEEFGANNLAEAEEAVKKGDYDEYLLGLGREVGYPEELEFNYIVGDIEIQATLTLFDDEGFTIRKATEQDFNELEFEMDELLRC